MVFIAIIMIIKWKRLCLFLFFLSMIQKTTGGSITQQDVKEIPLDGVLDLLPDRSSVPNPDNITGILWKHGPNKVAEWDQVLGPDVDFYGTYKKRTELAKETGRLVVNNMTKNDSGEYSVVINGKLQDKTYTVEVLTADPPEDSNITSTAEHQNISSSPTSSPASSPPSSSPPSSSPTTSSPTTSTPASVAQLSTAATTPDTNEDTSLTNQSDDNSPGETAGKILLVIICLASILLCGILYYLRRTSRTYSFDLQRPGPENHAPFTEHTGTFEPIHLEDLDNPTLVGSVNSDSPAPSSPVANGKDAQSGVTGVAGDQAPSGDALVVTETPPISSVNDFSLDVDVIDVTLDQPGSSGVSSTEQQNTNNNNPLGSSQCFVEVSLEEPAWNDLHMFPSPNPTSSVLPFSPFSLSPSSLPQQTIG